MSNCIDCENVTEHRNLFFNCYICKHCESSDSKYEQISLTAAKKEYLLTDGDINLAGLRSINQYIRAFRKNAQYFLLSDVQRLAYTLAGGTRELFELKKENKENELIERSQRIQETRITKRTTRKRKLEEHLQENGLELRFDSRLCENYIEKGQGKINEIVPIMKKFHILYEHTPYEQYLDDSYEEVREDGQYDGRFTIHWEENKAEQEDRALQWLEQKKQSNTNPDVPKCNCGEFKFDLVD